MRSATLYATVLCQNSWLQYVSAVMIDMKLYKVQYAVAVDAV